MEVRKMKIIDGREENDEIIYKQEYRMKAKIIRNEKKKTKTMEHIDTHTTTLHAAHEKFPK